MKTIIFDQNSWKWEEKPERNLLTLLVWFKRLQWQFEVQGHLYLKDVYVYLGIGWDPDDENLCYKKENGPINFTYEETDFGTYRILITQ